MTLITNKHIDFTEKAEQLTTLRSNNTLMSEYCVTDCTKCPALVENRTQIVNGVGPSDADILIIGEAPGQNEDETGEPFVGRSGDELDAALEDAGSTRDDVRITNTVRCRPPDNRDPTAQERANCNGYLLREILAVDPEVIIPVGKIPCETLLNTTVGITTEAGNEHTITVADKEYKTILSPHPAAMFYNRSLEPVFYETIERAVAHAED